MNTLQEIALPTAPFESVEDLYKDTPEDEYIEFEDENNKIVRINLYQKVNTNRGGIFAKDLQEGDEIWEIL